MQSARRRPAIAPRRPGPAGYLVGVLLLLAVVAARADAIDDYLSGERVARGIPGLALAVVRNGRVERVSAYGLADVGSGAPVTADSVFAIASLDKGITASGVVRAVEQGRVALGDLVTRYLAVPLPGVTIAMLVSHTAGLPDMDQLLAQQYGAAQRLAYSTEDVLDAVRGAAWNAAPGADYVYSDVGPFLAQLVTERVTGQPWLEWMQEQVFRPAGMSSVVSLDPHAVVPRRVAAYTYDAAQRLVHDDRTDVDFGPLYNDLGMTVGDFARWVAVLGGHGPLGADSRRALTTPTRLADGSAARELYSWTGYGLGIGLDDVLGETVWLHTGHSGVAYVAFPALDLGIVVFTNLEHPMGSDPAGLALGVAGLLEPRLSLRALAAARTTPATAAPLRRDYEQFIAGTPDLQRFAAHLRPTVWRNRRAFTTRLPRLGALRDWQFLRAAPLDGEPSLLFRASHEHGEIYARFSVDRDGRVSRFVWWHL